MIVSHFWHEGMVQFVLQVYNVSGYSYLFCVFNTVVASSLSCKFLMVGIENCMAPCACVARVCACMTIVVADSVWGFEIV